MVSTGPDIYTLKGIIFFGKSAVHKFGQTLTSTTHSCQPDRTIGEKPLEPEHFRPLPVTKTVGFGGCGATMPF